MIQLDTKTGNISFLGYCISPEHKASDLLSIFDNYISRVPSTSVYYIIIPGHENQYSLVFLNERLYCMRIFDIGDPLEGGDGMYRILKELGGEHRYQWGEVKILVNNKAGFTSVFIQYYN